MNIRDALRLRYAPPEFCLLFEVRNTTGFSGRIRSADAIAIGTYPSRGLPIYGFEFKASRGDWLNELKNPAKADEIAQYCDCWYLVVTDKAIVQPGELPPNWGLLVPYGEKLKCVAEAKKLEDSKPLSRGFFASLVRNMMKPESLDTRLAQQTAAVCKAERERYEGLLTSSRNHAQINLEQLQKKVNEFEQASGVKIGRHAWNVGEIGAAVRMVLNGELEQMQSNIVRMHASLTKLIEENKLKETVNAK